MRASDTTMCRCRLLRMLMIPVALAAGVASADQASEARLREQLRETVQQMRQLQDENTGLKIELERAKQQAAPPVPQADPAELEALRDSLATETRSVERLQADLVQHEEALASWKRAREEAVVVARERDGAARRFEALYGETDRNLKTCEAGNVALVDISGELLERYSNKSVTDVVREREPLLGLKRIELERLTQEYHGRIIDATVVPSSATGSPSGTADTTTAPMQP